MPSLKQIAIHGAVWTLASYVISQGLRFGSNLILARLLFPEAFGLMSLVFVFITGLNLFSDIGIAPSIIQNKRGDEPLFLNTAWTLQIIRSLAIWICTFLIAWPVAQFYQEPSLLWMLPFVGFGTFIAGFNSTAIATLNRQMRFVPLTIFNLVTQALTIGVMTLWAWIHPSVWALIGGNLLGSFFYMLGSHFLIPKHRNYLVWDAESARELFQFGRWIFVVTATTFFAGQSDRLILGRLFSLELLGIYGIAFALSEIPRQILLTLSDKVIFPAISQLAELPRHELRSKIQRNRWPVLLLGAFSLTMLFAIGDRLIYWLYDDRYQEAAWILPLLTVGVWPNVLSQTTDPTLYAIGKPYYVAYANFLRCLFILVSTPLGFYWFGIPGAVIAIALNDIPFYIGLVYGLTREKLYLPQQDLVATGIFLICLAVVLLGRFSLGFGTPIDGLLKG